MVVLMQLFAAALVVRRMYLMVAPRPFPAAPLVVRRRCLIVVPMPMPEAPRMYLIVVLKDPPAGAGGCGYIFLREREKGAFSTEGFSPRLKMLPFLRS
jgi:hypothetical protein